MNRLDTLRDRLDEQAEAVDHPERLERLSLIQAGDELHIGFFGDPLSEAFEELLSALIDPDVSTRLASLQLDAPDEGANGTKNWDLTPLGEAEFPRLRVLDIARARPGEHNLPIVARDYDENGILGRLLDRMPSLTYLTAPSAPSAEFFRVGERPLRFLAVDAGYDHQGFVRNLASSSCFPELSVLEFGEYRESYMADFADRMTPFRDYEILFDSPAFGPIRTFVWRNPACTAEEVDALRARDLGLSILVVRWSVEMLGLFRGLGRDPAHETASSGPIQKRPRSVGTRNSTPYRVSIP